MRVSFRQLARLFAVFLGAAMVVLTIPVLASAEEPDEVLQRLEASDGVYVASSRRNDYDRDALIAALDQAEEQGLNAVVIVPSDPFPNNAAFALRVRQAGEYDLVISFGPEDEVDASLIGTNDADPLRALGQARLAPTPEGAVSAFLTDMVTVRVRETPSMVGTVLKWAIVLVCILAFAVALEAFVRKRRAVSRARESGVDGSRYA